MQFIYICTTKKSKTKLDLHKNNDKFKSSDQNDADSIKTGPGDWPWEPALGTSPQGSSDRNRSPRSGCAQKGINQEIWN